jgi:hypothetical protein
MNIKDTFYDITGKTIEIISQCPWEDKHFYSAWIAQQYFLVQHTTRLICLYSLRIPMENNQAYKDTLTHLKEESGHDQWLLNDLKKLNCSIDLFSPEIEINALIKSQYYQISYEPIVSFLGYSQFLELLSVRFANKVAERVENQFGKGSAVFLRGHAEADQDHIVEGFDRMKDCSNFEKSKIIENLNTTGALYNTTLFKLCDSLKNIKAA